MKTGLLALLALTTAGTTPALAAAPTISGHQVPIFGRSLPQLAKAPVLGKLIPKSARALVKSRHAPPDGFTILDAPGAGTASGQGTTAIFVDSSGRATGYFADSDNNYHGFVRTSGNNYTQIDIDGPTSQTIPHWANDKGSITGDYFDSAVSQYQGFLRKANGKVHSFDGAPTGTHYTVTVSVNDKNAVVGYYYDDTDLAIAFLRNKDGSIVNFQATDAGLGPNQGTTPQDINNSGETIGYYLDSNNVFHGFIRDTGGGITEFDAPGAGTGTFQGTEAVGLNNKGWIIGDYTDSNDAGHGYLRAPDGTFTFFEPPEGLVIVPIEVNKHKNGAGWTLDTDNVFHGFQSSKRGAVTGFDAPGAGTAAFSGTQGYDINDDDVIVGWELDDSGVYHGFLRTP